MSHAKLRQFTINNQRAIINHQVLIINKKAGAYAAINTGPGLLHQLAGRPYCTRTIQEAKTSAQAGHPQE
jgi:hypothetical protein